MKYENLSKATRMCSDIDDVQKVLDGLRGSFIKISVVNANGYPIVSHSPNADVNDYPEMPIDECIKYRDALILHYSLLYSKLIKDLSEL
jgi:hypothetical protein